MAPCPAGFGTIFGFQKTPADKKSLTFVDSEDSDQDNLIVISRSLLYILIILPDTV